MIIAFAGQKGGSGKSTACVAVAAELVRRGQSVLLVDADTQGTARTWAAVASELGHPAPTTVAMGADMHKPGQIPRLQASFDHVLVDCAPRMAEVQRSALLVADLVVLPVGPTSADTWALGESLLAVEAAQGLRPDLQARVLITRKQSNTTAGAGARDALKEVPLFKTELGFRVAYQEAIAAGQGVTTYAPTSQAAAEVQALVGEILKLKGSKKHG